MNTYFAIMITILVAAQVIGIIQNAMYHQRRKKRPYTGNGKYKRNGYHGRHGEGDRNYRKDIHNKGDEK